MVLEYFLSPPHYPQVGISDLEVQIVDMVVDFFKQNSRVF